MLKKTTLFMVLLGFFLSFSKAMEPVSNLPGWEICELGTQNMTRETAQQIFEQLTSLPQEEAAVVGKIMKLFSYAGQSIIEKMPSFDVKEAIANTLALAKEQASSSAVKISSSVTPLKEYMGNMTINATLTVSELTASAENATSSMGQQALESYKYLTGNIVNVTTSLSQQTSDSYVYVMSWKDYYDSLISLNDLYNSISLRSFGNLVVPKTIQTLTPVVTAYTLYTIYKSNISKEKASNAIALNVINLGMMYMSGYGPYCLLVTLGGIFCSILNYNQNYKSRASTDSNEFAYFGSVIFESILLVLMYNEIF